MLNYEQIKEMYIDKGMTAIEIARQLNTNTTTLMHFICKTGLREHKIWLTNQKTIYNDTGSFYSQEVKEAEN